MRKYLICLLTLTSVIELSTVNTRYLLIELANRQKINVVARGDPACVPSTKTYKCNPVPSFYSLPNLENVLTCSKDENEHCKGNYVRYEVTNNGNLNVLELKHVNAEICKPKPEGCSCRKMVRDVLARYKDVDQIDGFFIGNPVIKACRCYLGSAANYGFQFVDFTALGIGCPEKTPFSVENYVDICEDLEERKCIEGIAKITRA